MIAGAIMERSPATHPIKKQSKSTEKTICPTSFLQMKSARHSRAEKMTIQACCIACRRILHGEKESQPTGSQNARLETDARSALHPAFRSQSKQRPTTLCRNGGLCSCVTVDVVRKSRAPATTIALLAG